MVRPATAPFSWLVLFCCSCRRCMCYTLYVFVRHWNHQWGAHINNMNTVPLWTRWIIRTHYTYMLYGDYGLRLNVEGIFPCDFFAFIYVMRRMMWTAFAYPHLMIHPICRPSIVNAPFAKFFMLRAFAIACANDLTQWLIITVWFLILFSFQRLLKKRIKTAFVGISRMCREQQKYLRRFYLSCVVT